MNKNHDSKCTITCTDNDVVAEADVDRFEEGKYVEVFIAQNKIKMMYTGRVYVGNKMGMEFTTPGPRTFNIKQGRGL